MTEVAVMILLLHSGEPLRFDVPWPVCLAEYRRWRHVDSTGGRVMAFDKKYGVKVYVREMRCEEREPEGEPTS